MTAREEADVGSRVEAKVARGPVPEVQLVLTRILIAEPRAKTSLDHFPKPQKLWIRHVKGHSGHEWNDVADVLADQGRRGQRRYGPPVNGEAREID